MKQFCVATAFLCLANLGSAAFDPAFNAAVGLYNQRKLAEAQHAFEALATQNPDNASIPFYLGRLALQRNDHEKAVTYLTKAVAQNDKDANAHWRLGLALAQRGGKGDNKESTKQLNAGLKLDPTLIKSLGALGVTTTTAAGQTTTSVTAAP